MTTNILFSSLCHSCLLGNPASSGPRPQGVRRGVPGSVPSSEVAPLSAPPCLNAHSPEVWLRQSVKYLCWCSEYKLSVHLAMRHPLPASPGKQLIIPPRKTTQQSDRCAAGNQAAPKPQLFAPLRPSALRRLQGARGHPAQPPQARRRRPPAHTEQRFRVTGKSRKWTASALPAFFHESLSPGPPAGHARLSSPGPPGPASPRPAAPAAPADGEEAPGPRLGTGRRGAGGQPAC